MAISTNGYMVTDHAILRYLKHTKSRFSRENAILKIVAFGEEIKPKNKLKKLLEHDCKDAKYFTRGSIVAVVANKRIVTVYPYNPVNWL